MKQLDLNDNIINFIINYLTNRTIHVSNNGTLSSQFKLENGSSQGFSSKLNSLFDCNQRPPDHYKTPKQNYNVRR